MKFFIFLVFFSFVKEINGIQNFSNSDNSMLTHCSTQCSESDDAFNNEEVKEMKLVSELSFSSEPNQIISRLPKFQVNLKEKECGNTYFFYRYCFYNEEEFKQLNKFYQSILHNKKCIPCLFSSFLEIFLEGQPCYLKFIAIQYVGNSFRDVKMIYDRILQEEKLTFRSFFTVPYLNGQARIFLYIGEFRSKYFLEKDNIVETDHDLSWTVNLFFRVLN